MENKSAKILEFDKILNIMSEFTQNEIVKKRILSLEPTADIEEARKLQAQTSEAASALLRFGNPPNMSAPSVMGGVKRCAIGGIASMHELLEIARLLRMTRLVKNYFSDAERDEFPILRALEDALYPNKMLEEQIFMCIISDEEMADQASGELAAIRRKMRSLQGKIKDMADSFIRSERYQRYLQEAIVTMRGDRYVIPVKAENKSMIPGIVHDVSSSGATVFIEPMQIVNANNEIHELAGKEQAEIERILGLLSGDVSEMASALEANFNTLTELDFIFCKGKLSEKYGCTEPTLNDEGRIFLKRARHPLIKSRKPVANDIYLGGDFDTLVITGPNTGGKTVTLKTIGLFCIMAASGLHIPVGDSSSVGVFSSVWADIGDEQSIEQSLSTFSSHMTNIVHILKNATSDSLVLFDELGAGTDPIEGAALAVSILEYLRSIGAKTAATTHYSELKLFALSTEGVKNASCEFNVETLAPTYRLIIGVPGKSNAFAISEKLGLDKKIIENAKTIMNEDNVAFENIIEDLQESKRVADVEAEKASRIRGEIDKVRKTLEGQKSSFEERRAKMLDDARLEARRIIAEARDEANAVIKDLNKLRKNTADKNIDRQIEEARAKLKKKGDAIDESFSGVVKEKKNNEVPKSVKAGDFVEVVSFGQIGEVLKDSDSSGNTVVQVGMMKMNVKLSDLRMSQPPAENTKKTSGIRTRGTYMPKKAFASTEIDVRGQSLEDALYEVDKYLSDAALAGLTQVSIIHGKGTGVLRNGIADMLKKHRLVKSYRLGVYGEGETGVTIVEIK